MERRKRRKFTPEYKAEVVKLVQTSGKSAGQVSSELGLTETAVRAWVTRAAIDEEKDPNGPLTRDERAEGTRLRRELRTVTMERDFPPKNRSLLRQERKMSFELIAAEEAHYPKALMCRALGLSRSGHHSFRTRAPSRRALGQQPKPTCAWVLSDNYISPSCGGLAVAEQEALEVAHGDGEVVGDPDLGRQADQAAVGLGDLGGRGPKPARRREPFDTTLT